MIYYKQYLYTSSVLCVDMIHYTSKYTTSIYEFPLGTHVHKCSTVLLILYLHTVPPLVCISSACRTWWRVGIVWIQWQRGGTRDGADRVDGLHEWSTHKYLDWLQVRTLCSVFKLFIPVSSFLVAAGCGLLVPLRALTAIENSRQGSPFPNIPHE